jgi:FAD-dependent urate hydroxylase
MDAAMSEPPAGLAALEARLRHDLACLNYPPANWVPPRRHQGREVADVVLVGAGMCGLVAAFSLLRLGIRNLRILDRSEAGREGPWITYARMQTLRSPKHLTGPAADLPALTFRAWYEAKIDPEAWERLGKIPRPMWMQYLSWYRQVLDLTVENGIEVMRIEPATDGLLRVALGYTPEPEIFARKVVLATGREGLGEAYIPDFVQDLPRERFAHSADPIDFCALQGRRVVVIGVGASAVDNAAEALEAGAAEVRLLARRKQMPRVNKLMGIGTPGFMHGFPNLSDLWRWRFIHYAHAEQTPPPRDSTLRVSRHPNASFHFGCGIRAMSMAGDAVRIDTVSGKRFETDFVILCTGFTVDHRARPELAGFAEEIATWADRFTPPADLVSEELAHFPYLAPDFGFTEREPGTAPWLKDIHCFNHAATLSLGKISGDIPAVSEGAALLARSIAATFYREDALRHYADLLAYAKPELLGDEWTDADGGEVAG